MLDIICLCRYVYLWCTWIQGILPYHLNLCHCHYSQRKLFQECATWYNYFFFVDEHIKLYVIWYIIKCNTFFSLFFSNSFSNFFLVLFRIFCFEIFAYKFIHIHFSNKIFLNKIERRVLSSILASDGNTFCL